MEITLKVELGLTPALGKMLERLLGPAPEAQPAQTSAPAPAPIPEQTAPAQTAPAPIPVQTAAAPAQTVQPAKTGQPEPPTDQVMRDSMDICLSRLAGNGWRESSDQKTLTIRRGCSAAFRQIARHLGAEKPTALTGEARSTFLRELDNIYINTADNSVEWKAF